MKYRNIQVAKMTGVKILAGLLVFGLTFSAPATAWAAESGLTEVTSNESENGEKLQAKSIGTEITSPIFIMKKSDTMKRLDIWKIPVCVMQRKQDGRLIR